MALIGGPSTPESGDRSGLWRRWLLAGFAVANLFVIGLVSFVIEHERQRAFGEISIFADSYARVLEQNFVGFIGRIDATLLTTVDEVARQRAEGGVNGRKLEALISRQDALIPEARGLRVLDEQGNVRYAVSGVNIPGANLGDRPYFLHVRDDPNAGLEFSDPVMGRVSNQWVVTLSRRVNNPDGSFGGEVNVAVATERFKDMLALAGLGTKGSATLWNGTRMVARYAKEDPADAKTGTPLPSPQLRGLIGSGVKAGSFHIVSPIDGIERLYQFRQVGAYPLYVVIGLADEDYLSEWRRDSFHFAGMAALFCIASAFLAWVTGRSWRQREMSERELRSMAARLSMVMKTAAEGIIGLDDQWRVMFATPAAASILGWSSAEAMEGKFGREVFGQVLADGSPCGPTTSRICADMSTGEAVRVMDEFFTRRNGTVIPVEYVVSPLVVSEAIVGAVVAFHDISERKALESERARAQARALEQSMLLDALLESVPLPLFYKDGDCRYLGCNHAFEEFFGAPRQALIGKTVYEIAPGENAKKYDEADHELIGRGGTQVYEWSVQRPDGALRQVIFRKATFLLANGSVGGIIGTVVDVTEQLETEKELLRSNAELERFAYVASHDLREPLRMITSFLALLDRRLRGQLDADSEDYIRFAVDGAKRMDALILGLLEYSRVGRAGEPTQVPLDEVIGDALNNLSIAIAEAKCGFR